MACKSFAAGGLCTWVHAIEDYAKCLKIVNPKRENLAIFERNLAQPEPLSPPVQKLRQSFSPLKQSKTIFTSPIGKMNRTSVSLKRNQTINYELNNSIIFENKIYDLEESLKLEKRVTRLTEGVRVG